MKVFGFISGVLVCLLLTAPGALRAQSNVPAQPPHRPQAPNGQNQVAGVAIGGPVGVLTDQQRASYVKALEAERGHLRELQMQVHAAQQDMLVTSLTETPFDEKVIREKAMAAAKIEAEMAVIRAKAFSKIEPPLTPEQIEKIKAGQPGPVRPLNSLNGQRFQGTQPHREAPANTNGDINGLPPKQ